jgi:hypothetical protein
MKTNRINIIARVCGCTVALALFAGIGGLANAQEKGATRLLRLSGTLVEPKSAPSDYKPMSCAKCTDRVVEVKDLAPTKGAGARALLAGGVPTKRVSTHECEGCGNTWVVSGHGKAKTSTAVHTCTSCGAESLACCSTSKKGVAATKGMEKKFEVAPVK